MEHILYPFLIIYYITHACMYVNYLIIILLTEKKNYITHIALIDAAPLAHRGCISNYNHTLANYNAHTNAHTLKHKHTHTHVSM